MKCLFHTKKCAGMVSQTNELYDSFGPDGIYLAKAVGLPAPLLSDVQ